MRRLLPPLQAAAAIALVLAFAANTPVVISTRSSGVNSPGTIETDGTLDLPFDAGEFTNGQVAASVLQPDGKVLIGGGFSKVHGVTRVGVARLNADGTLDSSFVPPDLFNLRQIILQPDGKIIAVVHFPTGNLVRLNNDGSLDHTFSPDGSYSRDGLDDGAGNATYPGVVNSAVLQPDGKIVIVGHFFHIITGPGTSVPRSCVARLNSDGTLDASFDPKGGLQNLHNISLTSGDFVVRQAIGSNNGKIIIEGNFDAFDFEGPQEHRNLRGLIRLNTDGSFDDTFDAGAGSGDLSVYVRGLFVQADDQLIVFGNRFSYFGVISRLNTSGQPDSGFTPPDFGNYDNFPQVLAVAQQPDGKLVIGGIFHSLGGTTANNVARLETGAARDNTFDSVAAGPLASNVSTVLVRPSDNKILVGGYFSTYGGAPRNNFAWANPNGSVDNTFGGLSGATDYAPEIYAVAVQADGKILVGGLFNSFNGVPHYNLVRLNPDSTIDPSFDPSFGTAGSVRAILVQPDGKIVIAGNILAVNGVARGRIARLNADGTPDPSFDTGTGADSSVYALAQDSAGNIYAGGAFFTFNGQNRSFIVKLTPTGAVDPAFNPGGGPNSTVFALTAPDRDGRIVIGGQFNNYQGTHTRAIARINGTNGLLDTGFHYATYYGAVTALLLAPDGKYYVAGSQRLVRLSSNGTQDMSFTPPATGGYRRSALALQNEKLVVAGHGGGGLPALARLTSTGALDPSFDPGTGVEVSPSYTYVVGPEVKALALQADGKLLIGGVFNKYDGTTRIGLARLTGPDLPDPTPTPTPTPTASPAPTATPSPAATPTPTPTPTPSPTPTPTPHPTGCGWLAGAAVPIPTYGQAVTSLGGHLYTFGGWSNGGRTANAYKFDGTTWTSLAPLPVALAGATAVSDGTNIFIMGGTESTNASIYTVNTLYKYDPVANSYVTLAPSAFPASDPAAVHLGGKIYKFSGAVLQNFPSSAMEIYDIATNSWTTGADCPFAWNLPGAFGHGNFIYLAGGYNPGPPGASAKTYRYDPATNSWDDAAIADLSARRWGAATASYNGGGIVAGGYVGGDPSGPISASTIFWDAASNSWLDLPDLLTGRAQMDGAVLNGSFHVVGGLSTEPSTPAGTNDNQKLTCPSFPTPTPSPTPIATPMPTPTPTPTPTSTPSPTPSPTPGLVGNVSTRLPVGTGDNALIQGFIVQGPVGSTKKIMVRALGPFLTQFGITDALANPTLEIRDASNQVVATNNDWKKSEISPLITGDQSAEIEASRLAPSDNRESAIIANLSPGNYTAVVRGADNTIGTGIVDAYDMSSGSPARLANVATRGFIQPGDKLMIAGFITQIADVRAVVRAIGPSLSAFGITNALPDTTLQLRDVNGAIVIENDDWQTDPQQKQELQATGLQPGDSREAAVIDTLPPGQYTVEVRGKPETTGIGVVEVYFLP